MSKKFNVALSLSPVAKPVRPYKPTAHPMQPRVDAFRALPSLVTMGTPPSGKGTNSL